MRRWFLRDKHWLLLSVLAVLLAPASGAQGQAASRTQGQSQSDQVSDQNQDSTQYSQQDQYEPPEQGQSPDQIQDQGRIQEQNRIEPVASTAGYSSARIVRISYVSGQVSIDHGQGYESATMNVPVTERNWLKTASDGWAEVQLEDGSLVRLAPDTVVAFSQLGRLSSGSTVTTVDLDQGEAEFKVAQGGNNEFQVTVKNKTVELDQPAAFRVTSTNADPMEVVVWKGEVSIRDSESGGEVAVKKNETFVLDPTDVAQYGLDKDAEADDLDQFSQDRDRYLSTYARGGYSQSPYQYGTGDLNYYGQYVDDPDYGTVWQPNGVSSDWDPFANGYWSYEPGFGYTWVSAYPWGWLPFRYGNWVFINNRGWCWEPGNWGRWHTGPTWVNAPPGFRPPRPPAGNNIVISGPPGGRVLRTTPGEVGGIGGHNAGTSVGGGRLVRQDGGDGTGFRGKGRVFTNDDVARVPRTDVPAQPVQEDNRPKEVERQPVANGSSQTGVGRFNSGDREPPRVNRQVDAAPPAQRSRVSDSPAQRDSAPQVSPPMRESAPPVREYTRPAETMRQSAPASAPMRQSAPAAAPMRQSAPPPAMHSQPSSGGGGSRSSGKQR